MTPQTLAKRMYTQTSAPIRTTRGTEYEIVARVTHRLKNAAQQGKANFAALAAAIHDNRQLWTVLATDVADDDNQLPKDLRARIFYLAEFTNHHSRKVLSEGASVRPLLELNMAVMRGLKNGRAVS